MALVTKEFKLDLAPGQLRPVVNASQGDIGRPFKAYLYWNGSPWTATGYTAKIRGKKADNTVFEYTATVSGSSVTFSTTEQMTIISGPVECELVFSNDGDIIASANFVLMVEDSPWNPDALSESDIPTIGDLIEDTIGGDVRDEVDALIEAHPELMLQDNSVTTPKIVDGAVTADKLDASVKWCVTPEMFGAVGDGVADDTTAWQNAVDSGFNVCAISKKYKCGQINVTKNISVHCNNAVFTCTAGKLFYCTGEVTETLTGENNYTDGQYNYTISSASHSSYTGLAMLKGENDPFLQRDYYRGGFVGRFSNGICVDNMPVDVETVSIDLINPVSVIISNIGGIVANVANVTVIYIQYGANCRVESITINGADIYSFVKFEYCYNCTASQCLVNCTDYTGGLSYNYPIDIESSSFTFVNECNVYNYFWHCATTGGFYLTYNTVFRNCKFMSSLQAAFGSHSNSNREIFENCTLSGAAIGEEAIVKNCVIVCRTNSAGANLEIEFSCRQKHTGATIDGLYFDIPGTTGKSGILISTSPAATGLTGYIDNIYIRNVSTNATTNSNLYCREMPNNSAYTSIVLGNIVLENVNIEVCFATSASSTVYNTSNYNLIIRNCPLLKLKAVTNYVLHNLYIENSILDFPAGTPNGELRYTNVTLSNNSLWAPASASLISGCNVKCRKINATNLNNSAKILLDAVYNFYDNHYYESIVHDGAGNSTYGRRLDTSGNVTTVTLT